MKIKPVPLKVMIVDDERKAPPGKSTNISPTIFLLSTGNASSIIKRSGNMTNYHRKSSFVKKNGEISFIASREGFREFISKYDSVIG